MKTASRKAAKPIVIKALLNRSHGRVELDQLLGWTNSCQCISELREQGFSILTTLDESRRAIYSLPFSEKPIAYQYLDKRNAK